MTPEINALQKLIADAQKQVQRQEKTLQENLDKLQYLTSILEKTIQNYNSQQKK